MVARRIALALAGILGVYLAFATMRAFDFLAVDDPVSRFLGIAILTMPVLGIAVIVKEVRFGFKTSKMGAEIDQVRLPVNGMSAEAKFQYLNAAITPTQVADSTWQDWYCLAMGCDLTGERKLAREAMRWSVHLYDELSREAVPS